LFSNFFQISNLFTVTEGNKHFKKHSLNAYFTYWTILQEKRFRPFQHFVEFSTKVEKTVSATWFVAFVLPREGLFLFYFIVTMWLNQFFSFLLVSTLFVAWLVPKNTELANLKLQPNCFWIDAVWLTLAFCVCTIIKLNH
jgi:hypothetical protein